MRRVGLLALSVLLLTATFIHAQATNPQPTRVTGRVMDPSGAVMIDVDVKAFRGDTLAGETKTDALGIFSLELPPAEYRMEITAPDFTPVRQNLRVVPNMPAVAVRMTLAIVNTEVKVGGAEDRVGIEDDKNLTSTTISGESVKDLPEDEDALMAQLQAIAGGSGAAGQNATFVVDGFAGGRVPPRDQIQQIIIDTNVFSAENTGGPRIQIITRPGTGPWSGNANFNFNDESLNAMNPADRNKPPRQQRIMNWSYGGPVIPGKLTMRFNARDMRMDMEGNSITAVMPDGPVNTGISTPMTNRILNLNGQLFVTANNTLSFGANLGRNRNENMGVGGLNLPERASNRRGRNWMFNLSDRAILNPKAVLELRFMLMRFHNWTIPVTDAAAIIVVDAFNGGGAQNRVENIGANHNFGGTLRLTTTPKVNIQIGFDGFHSRTHSISESNFGGTFTFASLAEYVARRPITFRQNSGNPELKVNQVEFASFVQADIRLTPKLNLGAGLRYQWQTNLSDKNNIGPTFQAAYQAHPKTVIRVGGRMTHQPFFMFNVEQLLRFDGTTRQFETVILNPAYPDPFANGSGITTGVNSGSIRTRATDLHAPYTVNSAFSIEQTLPKAWRVGASLDLMRGVGLIRTRNVNAPFPGTPLSDDLQSRLNSPDSTVQAAARNEVDRARPMYPYIGNINQFESTGTSFSKNIGFRVFTPNNLMLFKVGVNGFMNYTLGWTKDDASAMNHYDWRSEWGPASFDTRHRFNGNIALRLPRAMNLSFMLMGNSGRPYTITTGRDDNGDQSANDRPAGIARNSERTPSAYNVMMNFTKSFPLRKAELPGAAPGPAGAAGPGVRSFAEPQIFIPGPGMGPIMMPPPPGGPMGGPGGGPPVPTLTFNVQVMNLLNNTQVRGIYGALTSPQFGQPTGYANGRSIMAGLGFNF